MSVAPLNTNARHVMAACVWGLRQRGRNKGRCVMNLLTAMELALVAFGLTLFVYGKIPRKDADTDPLVRGAGLILILPTGIGMVAQATTDSSGMGVGGTILTAVVFCVSLLVCATLSVLLCFCAGGSF